MTEPVRVICLHSHPRLGLRLWKRNVPDWYLFVQTWFNDCAWIAGSKLHIASWNFDCGNWNLVFFVREGVIAALLCHITDENY